MLALGLLASWGASHLQAAANERDTQVRLVELAGEAEARIISRLETYRYGLRGVRGVVAASGEHLTRESFRDYSLSRDLAGEFPGALGYGFIERVTPPEERGFVGRRRAEGDSAFTVWQAKPRDGERWVVRLFEPREASTPIVGFDVASDDTLRAAAADALERAAASLSAPVTLMAPQGASTPTFVMFLPIFRPLQPGDTFEASAPAAIGWSFAPLQIDAVMAHAAADVGELGVRITDVTEPAGRVLFSNAAQDASGASSHEVDRTAYGRRWRFSFVATEKFVATLNRTRPQTVFWLVALAALALAVLAEAFARSQRRKAQLDEHRSYLLTLLDHSTDAMIVETREGRIASWNPAAQSMFGFSEAQALGQTLSSLIALSAGLVSQARASQALPTTETRCLRSDRSEIAVAVSSAKLTLEGESVVGFTLRDIRERKRADAQASEFNERLEALIGQRTDQLEGARRDLRGVLDGLPSMVGYWDTGLRNRFSNKAYSRWMGCEPEQLVGRQMLEVSAGDLFEFDRPYVEAALQGRAQQFERTLPWPDGSGLRRSLVHYLPDAVDGEVKGFYVLVHDITELTTSRLQLAVTLRENESLTATLRAHTLLSFSDATGTLTEVNDAFCSRSGYARDELIGRDNRVLNSGVHPPLFWGEVWATLAKGKAWRGEICNRAKDGSLFWVSAVIAPILGPQGEVEKFISIQNDISAAKALTLELGRERERLDRIMQATDIGTWEFNVQTGETRFNAQAAQLLGYPALTKELYESRMNPDDLLASQRNISEHVAGLTPDFNIEGRARHRDGTWRSLLGKGRVSTRTRGGTPEWVYGTFQDITASKAAQTRLAASEAILERAGRIASVGGWQLDLESQRVMWTSQTRRLLEVGSDFEPSAATLHLFVAPEARARMKRVLDEASAHGTDWDIEVPFVTSGGRRIWVRSLGEVERINGKPQRITGAFQDVSHRRAAEEELRRVSSAANAASEAKSAFLANMSHEIRTPLNAVIGMSYLLQESSLDEEQRSKLTKIQVASRGLLGIVNNVLDLAKIEAGELHLERIAFAVVDVLHEVEEVIATQASAKGLVFRVEPLGRLPPLLEGDPTRLRQVLINLANNAIKFTEQGAVTLRVSSAPSTGPSAALTFGVIDTGIGIAPEDLGKLFTPFTQADASTTRRFGGTGLGLSIVRRIVDQMGGQLRVSSTPGLGTEFWVTVTLDIATGGSALEAPQHRPLRLRGARILVVDDNPINVEVASRLLQGQGAITTACGNGRAAIDFLVRSPGEVDLVLMDTQMPEMDGNAATQRLRATPGFEALPIIALTAGALTAERNRAMAAGASAFLSKPYQPDELFRVVSQWLPADAAPADAPPADRFGVREPKASSWPCIAGIDHRDIERVLEGDVQAYVELLELFLADLAAVGRLPGGALTGTERAALRAQAHRLRGSAGVLGARTIGLTAGQLEAALADDAGPSVSTSAAIAALASAIDEVLASAPAVLAQLPRPPRAIAAGEAPDVEDLVRLLENRDIAALAAAKALEGRLELLLGGAQYQQLQASLTHLHFEQAIRLLHRGRAVSAREGVP